MICWGIKTGFFSRDTQIEHLPVTQKLFTVCVSVLIHQYKHNESKGSKEYIFPISLSILCLSMHWCVLWTLLAGANVFLCFHHMSYCYKLAGGILVFSMQDKWMAVGLICSFPSSLTCLTLHPALHLLSFDRQLSMGQVWSSDHDSICFSSSDCFYMCKYKKKKTHRHKKIHFLK